MPRNGQLNEAEVLSQRQLAVLEKQHIVEDDSVVEDNDLICIICGVQKRLYMVEPCGHFEKCGQCINRHRRIITVANRLPMPIRCPMCCHNTQGYRRVFQ